MGTGTGNLRSLLTAFTLVCGAATLAQAGVHTWDVNEVFTNSSGTIQFVELREANGTPGETGVPGQQVITNQNTFTIPGAALVAPTTNKTLLFATAGFAALPGAPAPNYTIPSNFFSTTLGNTIRFGGFDINFVYGAGALPTNGLNSLNENPALPAAAPTSGVNSPKNYAGATATLNLGPAPAVPDGDGPSTPMTVQKGVADGSTLRISWDTTSCSPGVGMTTEIIYGEGSDLPTTLGGTFNTLGAVCSVGSSSPFVWSGVPVATDGSGLLWWLMVIRDVNNREGSWGLDSALAQRVGPGPGGSSGLCTVTGRNLTNVCGQ